MDLEQKADEFKKLIEAEAKFVTENDFFKTDDKKSKCRINIAIESVSALGLVNSEAYKILRKFVRDGIIADFAFIEDLEDEDDFAWGKMPLDQITVSIIGILLESENPFIKQKLTGKEELSFYEDEMEGGISLGNQKCPLPLKTLEYYVAKEIIEQPRGRSVPEDNLFESLDRVTKKGNKPGRVRDAVRRINKKAQRAFGIANLIRYKNANFGIGKPG